jgi:hypothetical protein
MGELTTILEFINTIKDSALAVVASLIAFLAWIFRPRKCRVCKKDVLVAQMTMYNSKMVPIISESKDEYELDLSDHLACNNIIFTEKQKSDLLHLHGKIIDLSFSKGKEVIQSMVDWNHIPDYSNPKEYKSFMDYCNEKFNAHNSAVWNEYRDCFTSSFILDYHGRKEKWENKHKALYDQFIEMIKKFKDISTGKEKAGND